MPKNSVKQQVKPINYFDGNMIILGIELLVIDGDKRVSSTFIAGHFDQPPAVIRRAAQCWQFDAYTPASLRPCVKSHNNDFWLDLTAFNALVAEQSSLFDEQGIEEIRYALGEYDANPDVPAVTIPWQTQARWRAGEAA